MLLLYYAANPYLIIKYRCTPVCLNNRKVQRHSFQRILKLLIIIYRHSILNINHYYHHPLHPLVPPHTTLHLFQQFTQNVMQCHKI